jgi:hypothetical protein
VACECASAERLGLLPASTTQRGRRPSARAPFGDFETRTRFGHGRDAAPERHTNATEKAVDSSCHRWLQSRLDTKRRKGGRPFRVAQWRMQKREQRRLETEARADIAITVSTVSAPKWPVASFASLRASWRVAPSANILDRPTVDETISTSFVMLSIKRCTKAARGYAGTTQGWEREAVKGSVLSPFVIRSG